MKRYVALLMAAAVTFCLAACGTDRSDAPDNSESGQEYSALQNAEDAQEGSASSQTAEGKILIAYFTAAENSGVDAVSSASYSVVNDTAVGRLRAIADMIQSETGGNLFSIQTSVVYPADGRELIDYAAQEQEEDARPELTSHIEGLDEYETIFVGYPIWWGEAPHIVYSLVENVSLKKKTVIPFSTSISSGLGSSGKHLKARAKISSKTKWMKGRNFYDVPSQKTVNKWVKSMKY